MNFEYQTQKNKIHITTKSDKAKLVDFGLIKPNYKNDDNHLLIEFLESQFRREIL